MNRYRDTAAVLVIAPHGSYRTSAFVNAAQRLEIPVLIASEGKHSIVSEYVRGLHIDLDDPVSALEVIGNEARQRQFLAIIGTDDSTTELATLAAKKLGLPHNPVEAVRLGARKDLARTRLKQAGVPIPEHRCVLLNQPLTPQLDGLNYPLVVKPVSLSASRGVIRVNDEEALRQAIERIRAILATAGELDEAVKNTLLLEQFIPGQEVALEGMLRQGQLEVLAIFDKPDPLDGPFFEETYYITPSRHHPDVIAELQQVVQSACQAYGLLQGPIHAECRINPNGVWLLEVAARTIGGLCGRLVEFATGYSLEELVLNQAMGKTCPPRGTEQAAGVLMIPIPQAGVLKRVEGILDAQRIPFIESVEIQIREGYELVPLPEGGSYLGFIFAQAATPAEAEKALREAHACLNIVVAPLWKIGVA